MLPLTGALATSDTSVICGAVVEPYTTSVYGCSPPSGNENDPIWRAVPEYVTVNVRRLVVVGLVAGRGLERDVGERGRAVDLHVDATANRR